MHPIKIIRESNLQLQCDRR